MTKLSELHHILLAVAAKRDSGSILPPSPSLGVTRAGLTRAINALIKRKFVQTIETDDDASAWQTKGACKLAAVVTDAGRAAIAQADGKLAAEELIISDAAPAEPAEPQTKRALVIGMLRQPQGVTLTALVEATGWLPHTTRAALTGLRKKGHVIAASKTGGVSVYRIQPAA